MIRKLILVLLFAVSVNSHLLVGKSDDLEKQMITQEAIQHLPAPVQRCLEFSQVIGTPRVKKVELQQRGLFKIAADKPWAPFKAKQWFKVDQAAFEWKVNMKMAPFLHVRGVDRLDEGKGQMKIRLLGFIPLVNAKGPEIDQGSMTRYLSEMIWFPQGFLEDQIQWEAIDDSSARAILTFGDKSVDGVFHFDAQGRVCAFTCDRYATEGKEMVLRPWRASVYEYGERDGIMMGTKAKVTWERPEGDYTYIDLEITELKYE
ncbi:MAG: hypothetical protein K9N35_03890 [Candidatus Marinimicrobia bacterium]|nr:hypothetical protein [Candidatus Neomarinimicrobiota bacterium]